MRIWGGLWQGSWRQSGGDERLELEFVWGTILRFWVRRMKDDVSLLNDDWRGGGRGEVEGPERGHRQEWAVVRDAVVDFPRVFGA